MADTVIAERPPRVGSWEGRCARCGGEATFRDCETCGGEGVDGHECGEDCCMCLDPEDNLPCGICLGAGVHYLCGNSEAWCLAQPIPGRENVERHMIEWTRRRER